MKETTCVFCAVYLNNLSDETKKLIVAETENVIAFHDVFSSDDIHVLVIPKKHVISILEASDVLQLELLKVVRKVAEDIVKAHGSCRVMTNTGEYQDVKHLHWHVSYNR